MGKARDLARKAVRKIKNAVNGNTTSSGRPERVTVTFKEPRTYAELTAVHDGSWGSVDTVGKGKSLRYKSITCAPRIAQKFKQAFETE